MTEASVVFTKPSEWLPSTPGWWAETQDSLADMPDWVPDPSVAGMRTAATEVFSMILAPSSNKPFKMFWTINESKWLLQKVGEKREGACSDWNMITSSFNTTFKRQRSKKALQNQLKRLLSDPVCVEKEVVPRAPKTQCKTGPRKMPSRSKMVLKWTKDERMWLVQMVEKSAQNVLKQLADPSHYKQNEKVEPGRNGTRGGVNWLHLAREFELKFQHRRTAKALRVEFNKVVKIKKLQDAEQDRARADSGAVSADEQPYDGELLKLLQGNWSEEVLELLRDN